VLVDDATGRAFLAVDVFLFAVLLLGAGLLAVWRAGLLALAVVGVGRSCSSWESTSVTPYSAPTTRIASWSGSLESRVSFKTIASRQIHQTADRPPR